MALAIKAVLEESIADTSVAIRSFAKPLKEDLEDFIFQKFGIDVFDCTDEEKAIIRPIMVAYGGSKRAQTKGTYWTGLMSEEIARLAEKGVEVVIVPDVRYCEFLEDEVVWLINQGGFLIHVSKILSDGTVQQPPNEDERRNDPLLKNAADITVEWPEQDFEACKETARAVLGF